MQPASVLCAVLSKLSHRVGDERHGIDFDQLVRAASRLDAPEIEQALDHRVQPPALLREHTVVLRDAPWRRLSILQQLGKMAHRRQWCPELVRNRGDEI